MTLTQKIHAAAAMPSTRAFPDSDRLSVNDGWADENARLLPLITALADVASAAEEYVQTDGGEMYDLLNIALERLRAQIGGRDE